MHQNLQTFFFQWKPIILGLQKWYQIFVSGTGSDFSEVKKSSESGFFLLSKRALLVPETKI